MNRKEIEEYAKSHWASGKKNNRWNGRQIKNAFQTAVALADWDTLKYTSGQEHSDGPLLERRHFEMVAKASAHFDLYLEKVRGTDQFLAKNQMMRRDDVPAQSRNETRVKKKTGKAKPKPRGKPTSPESTDRSQSEEDLPLATESSEEGSKQESNELEEEPVPEPPRRKRPMRRRDRET